uniref:WGS project CAEQ00000000 data, annotated contig 1798 n=1 Tax=Trypanosoma congolense (strain IL3000) TaxID=1068625 RepID=F9W8Y1_TRYCI|nr:unnamed protein product [Trypanosoma congolense IL3000]
MSSVNAIQRLSREKKELDKSRVREFYAAPIPDNIFEWHFTLLGPAHTPYADGLYHGILRFPREYPFKPPDITFLTPNGRFQVGKSICSSISSYHPELWCPSYNVTLILVALRVFMGQDDELGVGALARQYISADEKQRLARESRRFSCPACGMRHAEDIWQEEMERHPPVGAEVEAKVPKLPPSNTPVAEEGSELTPDAITDSTREDGGVIADEEGAVEADGVVDDKITKEEANLDEMRELNAAASQPLAEDAIATRAVETEAEAQEGGTGEKIEPLVAEVNGESKLAEENGEVAALQPGVLIGFGDFVEVHVPFYILDATIRISLFLCIAVIAKKALWY